MILPKSTQLPSGVCNDKYQIRVYSNECSLDNCLSAATVTYPTLQSFEGFVWQYDRDILLAAESGSVDKDEEYRIIASYRERLKTILDKYPDVSDIVVVKHEF